MSAAPVASIVIPTFNRRDSLERVLSTLDRQTVPPEDFEAVVVDDGSTDGTGELLARIKPRFALSAARQENSGPARARNAGVALARSETVLFLDDDMEPLPELLQEHLSSHAAHPRSVIIGPLVSLPRYDQPWVAWEQVKLEAQYAAMARGDWEPSFRQFWTGNASVSRRELLEAGGFDVTLLRGEDVEFGYRLAQRGLSFRFNPRARGLHHAKRSLASWENAHRSYGRMEVDVFERMGDERVLDLLAGNWSRLHPVTRAMVRLCAGHGARTRVTAAILRKSILLGGVAPMSKPVSTSCSLLANLLYWDACLAELGPDRAEQMLAKAASQR